jgi:flagellar biosynthesis protein FliQ
MSENMIMAIVKNAINTGLIISAPVLIISLVVGLIISIFQATTQIQEQTLTFVPKLIAIAAILIFSGSWMLHKMVSFTQEIFDLISVVTK